MSRVIHNDIKRTYRKHKKTDILNSDKEFDLAPVYGSTEEIEWEFPNGVYSKGI